MQKAPHSVKTPLKTDAAKSAGRRCLATIPVTGRDKFLQRHPHLTHHRCPVTHAGLAEKAHDTGVPGGIRPPGQPAPVRLVVRQEHPALLGQRPCQMGILDFWRRGFLRSGMAMVLKKACQIANYLSIHRDKYEAVFKTLDYFDVLNFVRNSDAPAYFSVALMDTICPPSTVFAARNTYAATTKMEIFRFNDHEGGQGHHWINQVNWLRSLTK